MDIAYRPYFDAELEVLIERLHPPRVCIDNETYPDCTLVKIDSANKQGMLLEMVQVLTDLNLLISKSYISSDGGWLMDVFHVTDHHHNKLTDKTLIRYIEEAICSSRNATPNKIARPKHLSTEHMAFEMTGIDRPGLMSEMSAVLAELGCHVSAAVAWTHRGRVACIMYVGDSEKGGPNMDPSRVSQVQAQLENVVEARHRKDELRSVRLAAPIPGRTHTERRLHQLMAADRDYEDCCSCGGGEWDEFYSRKLEEGCNGTHVNIEKCKENGYSIITVRSRDRPKLLFDTVCTLTDLKYEVHHAAISSQESTALQEYYVKEKDGYTLDSKIEQHRVIQCLIAATERRIYHSLHGLKLGICTRNRMGLLSDVTRVLRENGLSINLAEIGVRGENAVGTFYVRDTTGQKVSAETVEMVRREIGGQIVVENVCPDTPYRTSREEERSRFSLWTQLQRLSINFGLISS